MKYPVAIIAPVAGMLALCGEPATAGTYPIAPPGTFVTLQPEDFIQSIPEASSGVSGDVIGDDLGRHPGAFASGNPEVGEYFIGVFGGPIDTSNPDAAVYLWETTGGRSDGVPGPQITLGYWDGMTFTAYGNSVTAMYYATGAPGNDPPREINSSITRLSEFGIAGNPILNAVEIRVVDQLAENQVAAVAATVIPEPSSLLLLGAGLVGLIGWGLTRQW